MVAVASPELTGPMARTNLIPGKKPPGPLAELTAMRQAARIQQLAVQAAEELASAQTEKQVRLARSKWSLLAGISKAFDTARGRVRIEQGKPNPGQLKPSTDRKPKRPRAEPRPIAPKVKVEVSTPPTPEPKPEVPNP